MLKRLYKDIRWGVIIWMGSFIVLGFVVLFALYSYSIVEREMAAQFNREQALLAEQTAMSIQQYMNDIINVLNLSTHIEPVANGKRDEIKVALKNAYNPLKSKVIFLFWEDAAGIMKYHYPEDVLPGLEGKDFSFRTYFQVAREMRVPYVSDIIMVGGEKYKDIPGRFESFVIAFPLIGDGGRFNGVIGCAIDLENITAHYVAPIKPSKTGYAWLMDETGMLLYHPNPKMLGMNLYEVIMEMRKQGIKIKGVDEVRRAMELKNDGMYEIVFPHHPTNILTRKLLAFSSVHFLNRRWVTVVTSPYSEVVYLMSDTFRVTLILGSVSIAFVLVATIIMLRINKERVKADERNRWADEVLVAHKRLESIFDGVPHYLAMIDTDFIIRDVNQKYCELYGKRRQDLIGKHCFNDFPARETFFPKEIVEECLKSATIKTVNDRHIEIQGLPYYFDISAIPLFGALAKVEYVVQYGVDITEKKALTEKLIQAEKLAAVGQISAHMAHEIRNPLTSVLLHSELLLDELKESHGEDHEAMKLLKIIMEEIDRLTNVTDEYLAYARLPVPKKQLVNPEVEASSVQAMMLPELKRRSIDLSVNSKGMNSKILIDRGQFRQVLINLIKNAMDAMPSGGGIEISLMEVNKNFVLFVKDTGYGIPKEIARRIFDPYFTTKENGTGLGLYLVQYIANAHEGWVDVESQQGSGSTFVFSIPINTENT
jgi:PAS domain S-box-containing protein